MFYKKESYLDVALFFVKNDHIIYEKYNCKNRVIVFIC